MIDMTEQHNARVGTTDDDLEAKAAGGDRSAIRELRLRKLGGYAYERIHGKLKPDTNGRAPFEPGYVAEEKKS